MRIAPLHARSTLLQAGALLLLALPLYLAWLGAVGLSDPDEPYYAVPALEMLKSGTWSLTIFRGQPWFDKPILFYWVVLGAYRLVGVSEFAARIGSALAGAAGVLGLFAMREPPNVAFGIKSS